MTHRPTRGRVTHDASKRIGLPVTLAAGPGLAQARKALGRLISQLGVARIRTMLGQARRWLNPSVVRIGPGVLSAVLWQIDRHALGQSDTTSMVFGELLLLFAGLAEASYGAVVSDLEQAGDARVLLDLVDGAQQLLDQVSHAGRGPTSVSIEGSST